MSLLCSVCTSPRAGSTLSILSTLAYHHHPNQSMTSRNNIHFTNICLSLSICVLSLCSVRSLRPSLLPFIFQTVSSSLPPLVLYPMPITWCCLQLHPRLLVSKTSVRFHPLGQCGRHHHCSAYSSLALIVPRLPPHVLPHVHFSALAEGTCGIVPQQSSW